MNSTSLLPSFPTSKSRFRVAPFSRTFAREQFVLTLRILRRLYTQDI